MIVLRRATMAAMSRFKTCKDWHVRSRSAVIHINRDQIGRTLKVFCLRDQASSTGISVRWSSNVAKLYCLNLSQFIASLHNNIAGNPNIARPRTRPCQGMCAIASQKRRRSASEKSCSVSPDGSALPPLPASPASSVAVSVGPTRLALPQRPRRPPASSQQPRCIP